MSVADRIDQIRVNLERLRWVMHEIEDDFQDTISKLNQNFHHLQLKIYCNYFSLLIGITGNNISKREPLPNSLEAFILPLNSLIIAFT